MASAAVAEPAAGAASTAPVDGADPAVCAGSAVPVDVTEPTAGAGPVAPVEVTEPTFARRGRTVLTALWLVALVIAAIGVVHDQWWPVEAGAMFSFATPTATAAYLEGRDASGAVVAMPPSGFGVDDYEMSANLRRAMGPQIDFDDRAVLATMASWWNERHPDRKVVEVSLRMRAIELNGGGRHDPVLLTWRPS